ncbi:MAG: NTP transferase domain-containing protein [Nocardioidaceae bacterium]|nr:NTP transferase domain-containing protein [Nocardioidaceae bacterium]
MTVAGLLLAAGAGTRYGKPKALVDGWLAGAVAALRDGGCSSVTVVLGAAADETRRLVPSGASIVVAPDWDEGMGASLRAGLSSLGDASFEAVVVHLVDLPDVGPFVVRRLLGGASAGALARATYGGRPGHPVLIGRDHWAGVIAGAVGDQGARDYLRRHQVDEIECGDLAEGDDVDVQDR